MTKFLRGHHSINTNDYKCTETQVILPLYIQVGMVIVLHSFDNFKENTDSRTAMAQ